MPTNSSKTYPHLISLTGDGARLEQPMDAVSVVSSLVGAIAVVCPSEVFFKEDGADEYTPFFAKLDETRRGLDAGRVRKGANKEDVRVYSQWHWGATIGIFQILQWPDFEDLGSVGISARAFYGAAYTVVVPYLVTLFCLAPAEMPQEVFTRVADMLQKFQNGYGHMFDLIVRQINKQKGEKLFSGSGHQIWQELRNRYWYSRSCGDQEKMIGYCE